ncbi:MAG TPA: flagellar hook capping FlgD N-terminal domain-containing protein [Verrucomicrobiae bacterium]|nr:flagellar hook capping FlgD N-terminal domain-containing protein [Verrucomicrobiae bacterium]
MITPIAHASTTPTSGSSSSDAGAAATPPVNETMFLQLLVAQLQNQDPMNPTDSTTFVTQLAQFQQLEQSINNGQDLSAMRQDLDTISAAYTSSPTQSSSKSQA